MSTTIVAASAAIKLTVTLILGGKTFDIEFNKTISAVTRADRNIFPAPTNEVSLVALADAAGISKGSFTDFNGFFVINRDDTNFVRLRISQNGGDTVDFKLEAGDFMILWNKKIETNTTEAAFGAFVDFDTVSVQADTAIVDLEFLAIQV